MDEIRDLTAEDIVETIRECVEELKRRCRRQLGEGGERFRRTCLAELEINLGRDHGWLGRAATTLPELARALDGEADEDEADQDDRWRQESRLER